MSAQISSRWCQSLDFLASRDTSRPITIPAFPIPASLTSRRKPARSTDRAPDCPRSESITSMLSAGQPRAMARSRSAYWRSVLSVFSTTCRRVDCRT